MGSIRVSRADYIVADQTIDVLDILNELQEKNYGIIELSVSKLDADLRKDNRIITKPDADSLKLTPPKLLVDYADKAGRYHHVETPLTGTLKIGERSSYGQFVQKPGELLFNSSVVLAKGQMLFVFAFAWTLVVVWTYKQFQFLEAAFGPGGPAESPQYPSEKYGVLGQWTMYLLYLIYYYVDMPSQPIGRMFSPDPPYGWLVKVFFSIASALAPVAGFFTQFIIWLTAVSSIPSNPSKV
jgi:hypothetical protein